MTIYRHRDNLLNNNVKYLYLFCASDKKGCYMYVINSLQYNNAFTIEINFKALYSLEVENRIRE